MADLPNWIPADAWAGYVEMRVSIKKPLKTERAINLAINTLERLQTEGNDPGAVLDQSTLNGWQGLFAVRVERRGLPKGHAVSALGKSGQVTANNAQDWLEEQC
jgi:hypothetical protein